MVRTQKARELSCGLRTRPLRRDAVVAGGRIAIAIVTLAALMGIAAPAPTSPTFSSMTSLTSSIDASAKVGDWIAVERKTSDLSKDWKVARPSVAHGVLGNAHAQSVDASLKWIESAIVSRDRANVHRAALNLTKSIGVLAHANPGLAGLQAH